VSNRVRWKLLKFECRGVVCVMSLKFHSLINIKIKCELKQ
jgi:hypothetical protein